MSQYKVVLSSPSDVLREKIVVWTLRAKYAKGARRAECEAAIDDLHAKLDALEGR